MSDCSLCRIMGNALSSGSVSAEQARAAFLCGVATGEFLAWKGAADLCERCADTIAQARGLIQRVARLD